MTRVIELGQHILIHGDGTDPGIVREFLGGYIETLIHDPPFDDDLIAWRAKSKFVLAFCGMHQVLDMGHGWSPPFRSLFVWDTRSLWHRGKAIPLQRGKCCLWFAPEDFVLDHSRYPIIDETVDLKKYATGLYLTTIYSYHNVRKCRRFEAVTGMRFNYAKPVTWVRGLIGNCTEGTVFDPFSGSGTSLIAADSLGRRCVCVEKDPVLVDAIQKRFWAHRKQSEIMTVEESTT